MADIQSADTLSRVKTFSQMFRCSFFFEELIPMGEEKLQGLNFYKAFSYALEIIYGAAFLILVVKILEKGFLIYELGRDGDAEVGPGSLVIGGIAALVIAAAFPTLYRILANTVIYLADKIITKFIELAAIAPEDPPETFWALIGSILSSSVHSAGNGAVYGIMVTILSFMLLGRGVEMLIYRLGLPLAAIGLVNSDGGVWKSYIQLLFQTAALSITQIFCVSVGLLVTESSVIFGMAFLITGISAPKLLSKMFPPQGGGRLTQTVYLASSIGRLITH